MGLGYKLFQFIGGMVDLVGKVVQIIKCVGNFGVSLQVVGGKLVECCVDLYYVVLGEQVGSNFNCQDGGYYEVGCCLKGIVKQFQGVFVVVQGCGDQDWFVFYVLGDQYVLVFGVVIVLRQVDCVIVVVGYVIKILGQIVEGIQGFYDYGEGVGWCVFDFYGGGKFGEGLVYLVENSILVK